MKPLRKDLDMIKKLSAARNFVADHKVAIAVTVTAITCLTLNKMALKDHDNFLKQHDLFDLYYHPQD